MALPERPSAEGPSTEGPDVRRAIEHMVPAQFDLAKMMLTTKVDGKLRRRYGEAGSFTYPPEERGRFPMITIAQDPEHEFVGAANLKDPQNPDIPLLPYYANLRGGIPEDYEVMARALAEKVEASGIPFDYITGIPDSGNAIAKALAEILGSPCYEVLEKTGEGSDRKFKLRTFKEDEARPEVGMKALVVDDLITKKTTKDEAEAELVRNGFGVSGHAVVYDREEGGMEDMRDEGRNIVAGLTATQLFAVALLMGKVSGEVYDTIMGKINDGKRARSLKRTQNNA